MTRLVHVNAESATRHQASEASKKEARPTGSKVGDRFAAVLGDVAQDVAPAIGSTIGARDGERVRKSSEEAFQPGRDRSRSPEADAGLFSIASVSIASRRLNRPSRCAVMSVIIPAS